MRPPSTDLAALTTAASKSACDPCSTMSATKNVGYATERWISIVCVVAKSRTDVPTLADWSRESYRSVGTLKRWCAMCGLHAGESLDFARALRIVINSAGRKCDWFNVLSIADPMTLGRFVKRAGFVKREAIPDLISFLDNQHFVTESSLLNGIRVFLGGVARDLIQKQI